MQRLQGTKSIFCELEFAKLVWLEVHAVVFISTRVNLLFPAHTAPAAPLYSKYRNLRLQQGYE